MKREIWWHSDDDTRHLASRRRRWWASKTGRAGRGWQEGRPTLDVGCGALVYLRRQQATQCTPPNARATLLSQQATQRVHQVVYRRTLRTLWKEAGHHQRQLKFNVAASQPFTNTTCPQIFSQCCIARGRIRLACCIHAAMTCLYRRTWRPCRPGLVVPTRLRSNRPRDTGKQDTVVFPMRSLGRCRGSPWLLFASVVMALFHSCTIAEALCMDSSVGDTIRLRLRGTDHTTPD